MRIRAGTLAVDITADGRSLESTLKRSDSLTEAFATNIDRRMKRASGSLKSLGQAAGMTDKEIASLEDRMRKGMAADAASRSLEQLRRTAGLTTQEYKRMAVQLGVTTKASDKAGLSLSTLAKRAGAAAAAYLSIRESLRVTGDAFSQFANYQADLTDMGKVTTESLDAIDAKMKAMPRALGDSDALVKGYYQTISAGVTDSAEAMDMLTTAAEASKAAHVAQDQTIKALTKTMAGFDGEIKSATEASDLLFSIEKLGQTSFAELVPVIGDVAESTHLVGVTSQEMAAGLSLITQTSGSTAEAATKWRAIMIGLYKPTENMGKVLKALGYESGVAMVKEKGFAGALQTLQATADKSHFSLGKLFESSEALTGIAGLGAQDWERYAQSLGQVQSAAGGTNKAFQDYLQTAKSVKDTYDSTLRQMSIEFGQELAPMMTASMETFSRTIQENKDPIITTLGGIETSVGAITSAVMAATREYQTFANTIAAGIAVIKGEMSFGDWALSGPEELAKKLKEAGDAAKAAAKQQSLEAKTQQIMAGDNTGTIPELSKMFPGDFEAKAQKAKKAVDGIKVSLDGAKKSSDSAANAAARYGERSDAYFDQVQATIASLTDSLSGGMESETLKVDKTFERVFADIRKSLIGAKGDTEGFSKAWVAAEQAWPILRMAAQLKDFEKELDKSAKYARDMGTYLSDPDQLMAADWLEGYKQYLEDLREARAETDQEDAAAVAKAQARWDAYQEHVLQSQRERLGEGGKLSGAYWQDEAAALQKHLDAVKEVASDETAAKIYEAERWDEFLKERLEEEVKYAGSFGETMAAKWSLAFGGYESETTRAKKRWDTMADGIIQGTNDVVDGISGGMGDIVRSAGEGADAIANIGENLKSRLLDIVASLIEQATKMLLNDFIGMLSSGVSDGSGSFLSSLLGKSSSSSGGSDVLGQGTSALKTLGDYLGQSAGEAVGDTLTTAASSGSTLFLGGSNAMADIFSDGIDMSALGAAATTYNTVGAEAMASTYSVAETAGMAATSISSILTTALPIVGAIGGAIGLFSGLFGEKKEEVRKTASGYNVGYSGGSTTVSGVDFYSDGSVVGTGVADPDVTREISESFRDAAEAIDDAAENLGFAVDNLIENFTMPSMNITEDQLGTYIENGTNLLAFQALEQAGLRGAFDALADDGQTYIDQIQEFSAAFSTVAGSLSAYGYEMTDVAQITGDQVDALRQQTIETAAGTSQAILTMASSMGATSDQLAILAENASDGSQALAVTDEQLQNLLAAKYSEDLLNAVGGEDAFASIMTNLTSNIFSTVDAYVENLGYYTDKATDSIGKLGDASVTIDNFWTKFDAAIKNGLSVDEFEAWGKASQWVANLNSVNDAIAAWNDSMTQFAQSLDVRMLKAKGLDYEAEITQLATDAEWELADARAAGYDAALIARLKEVQDAEMAAKIAAHLRDYADKLRDANKRYATAVGDSGALVQIAIEENALELQDLAKEFNWSVGSAEEGLFQALQKAQWAEIINMIEETADTLAKATEAMEWDLRQRQAVIAGYDEEAEALGMVKGFLDELDQAYADGLDADLIAELMQTQMDELAKYWSDTIDEMQDDLQDLYTSQSELLDSLTGNTQSAIQELYALFARYQAGETDLADDIIDSLSSIADAIDSMVDDIYDTIYEIRTGSEYTTDDAETVAANAKAYFDEQAALAASGDTTAMANITSYGTDYLDALRSSTADESVYNSGVDYVTSTLSSLASGAASTSGSLTDIATTVTDDQIAEAEAALKRAEVAQLETTYQTLWAQAVAAFQGSKYGELVAQMATTGVGWSGGVANLLSSDYWDGGSNSMRAADAILVGEGGMTAADYVGWFLSNYGVGTGYVDWDAALSQWVSSSQSTWPSTAALPSGVMSLYAQATTAYDDWQSLKSEYGFATGGMIEGGIPGQDSVFVLGKPGEAVLTEYETDLLLYLARQLGGISAGASDRDDLASEVVALRQEVVSLHHDLAATQAKLADKTTEIASMLIRCGGKDGTLMVSAQ
ncbi:phage tail tape measure protein [Desulfovibrio sp. JY]|nr:phage tail tape measure protein [Desulfovibrio sp. JY]